MTDMTLTVVAGSDVNSKLPTLADHSMLTVLMRNRPVKPCTGSVTLIVGSEAVQRV
jgi:hypothetical protein